MIAKTQSPLWDPIDALGIINPDGNVQTCLAYAPSQRRRCGFPILATTRVSTKNTLRELSYLHPSDPKVMKNLKRIVGPGLCWRHRGDAQDILMKCRQVLRHVQGEESDSESDESEMEDVRPAKSARPGKSSKKRDDVKERTLSDAEKDLREMRELYANLREQLENEKRERKEREERDAEVSRLLSALLRDKQEEERKCQSKREEENRRQEKLRMEKERLEKERLETERLAKECLEKERLEKERLERQRLEKERLERERLEKERQEKERLEKEQAAKEEKKRQDEERNERIHQRAQKRREETERLAREKAEKEREEWDVLWKTYQENWVAFKASACRDRYREDIPWPVKAGQNMVASTVKEFFQKASPRDTDMAKLMKRESLKWHPNCPSSVQRLLELGEVDMMRVDMICRVLTGLIDEYTGKEAGCFE